MERIDRTKIQEVPIESDPCGDTTCDECNIGGCPHGSCQILDADKHQQEQISTRYSLRRLK